MAGSFDTKYMSVVEEKDGQQDSGQGNQDQNTESQKNNTSKRRALVNAWSALLLHGCCCVALALAIALGLDGYHAGDDNSSRFGDGRLLLHVSDVTTLVSVALVVIKIIAGAWSSVVLWACARYILSKSDTPSTLAAVSSMIRWKWPPGMRSLSIVQHPGALNGLNISVLTLSILIQAFSAPILTGSLDWNVGFRVSDGEVPVRSAVPVASFGTWYWYNAQGSFDKKGTLRTAAGYANLEWADPSTVGSRGESITGNGCRHIFNNDGLPPNSTLRNAVFPCIDIHDIQWFRSENDASDDDWADVEGDKLTLVGDNPISYYQPGVSFVYNATDRRPGNYTTELPPAYMFSGTKTVALMLGRQDVTDPPCTGLTNTIFGNIDALGYHRFRARVNSDDENCYLIGRVNFTAGVTTSRRATYITPRIAEDQTPIKEVDFRPDPWVHEAIWLLPDLMTMLSVMNSSQLPSYNSIDGHVGGLLRHGYLAAWGMLAHSFNEGEEMYSAMPAEARLVADVSFARVFTWLALCLLMTACGALMLRTTLWEADLRPPEEMAKEEGAARKEDGTRSFLQTLLDGYK